MLAWIMANWMQVAVALLAIDAAVLKLFPSSPVLNKIFSVLSSVAPKQ